MRENLEKVCAEYAGYSEQQFAVKALAFEDVIYIAPVAMKLPAQPCDGAPLSVKFGFDESADIRRVAAIAGFVMWEWIFRN